jgi:hypothetical protein
MTQKELLYYEDAIQHENSITKICEEAIKQLTDESLIEFINDEISKHQINEKRLLDLMEDKVNGQ